MVERRVRIKSSKGKLLFGPRGEVLSGSWELRRVYDPKKKLVFPREVEGRPKKSLVVPGRRVSKKARLFKPDLFVVAGEASSVEFMQKHYLTLLSRSKGFVGKTSVLRGRPDQWAPFELLTGDLSGGHGFPFVSRVTESSGRVAELFGFTVARSRLIAPSFLEVISKQHKETPHLAALKSEISRRIIERSGVSLPSFREFLFFSKKTR
ncbi:MAG: hypothetical protein ACE5DI_02915 [Candidatus Micrarchaeia archaeon]